MPTYYHATEGACTITGTGAPVSADVHQWSIFSAKPMANATPFTATDRSYVGGIKEHRFRFSVLMDKEGTTAPLPDGTAFTFAGRGGDATNSNDYAWSGEIESSRTGFDSLGGNRVAVMIYEGRVNGAVTVS